MKTTSALIVAFCLTAAAPVFAAQHEMDIAAITCAEYDDMDDAGKMGVVEALIAEMDSMQNVEAAMIEVDSACTEGGNTADTTVVTAMTAGASE